jgi:hypothetical protein
VLGVGGVGFSAPTPTPPTPNPQSPIPNPQLFNIIIYYKLLKKGKILYKKNE